MGSLTVKESGEMVNFISPNVNNITSFKVHFSPRQEGSGDPSPENVRKITGWNGVEGYISNVAQPYSLPSNTLTAAIDWTEDIGTVYGGYVDLISGELVQTWQLRQISELGIKKTSGTGIWEHRFDMKYWVTGYGYETSGTFECLTDCFTLGLADHNNSFLTYVGNLSVYDDTVSTADEFKAKYGQNYVAYKIKSDLWQTHQLTPQQLSTLKGQNNFWSNADYVEIEYELTETFDIQKAKRKIILSQPHVESASGDLVTFDTDMKGKLKECKVYFSPVQEGEGDPSPDNVRNIVGWNGVSVYSPSENLIPSDIPAQFYRVNPSASDGHFIGSGVAYSTFIIPVPKGKICLARTTRDFLSYGALCDEPPTVGSNAFNVVTMTNRNSHVFDNSDGHKYFAITTKRSVEIDSDWEGFLSTEPRLTIGDVAQPYTTPTNISTYSVDWTDSAGTVYGGYVDLVSGELVQTYWGFVADGENIKVNSNRYTQDARDIFGAGIVYNTPTGISSNNLSRPTNIYCNKIPVVTNEKIDIPYIYTPTAGALYMVFYVGKISEHPEITSKTDTLNFVNNWLQENPLQIIYQLATPIYYQLTPQQLTALRGTNTIYSNANGQIDIKYWTRFPKINYMKDVQWLDHSYITSAGKLTEESTAISHTTVNSILLPAGNYRIDGFCYQEPPANSLNCRVHEYNASGSWVKLITSNTASTMSPYILEFSLDHDSYIKLSLPRLLDAKLIKI